MAEKVYQSYYRRTYGGSLREIARWFGVSQPTITRWEQFGRLKGNLEQLKQGEWKPRRRNNAKQG